MTLALVSLGFSGKEEKSWKPKTSKTRTDMRPKCEGSNRQRYIAGYHLASRRGVLSKAVLQAAIFAKTQKGRDSWLCVWKIIYKYLDEKQKSDTTRKIEPKCKYSMTAETTRITVRIAIEGGRKPILLINSVVNRRHSVHQTTRNAERITPPQKHMKNSSKFQTTPQRLTLHRTQARSILGCWGVKLSSKKWKSLLTLQ